MSMPRFYCQDLNSRRATLAAEESRHAITVLRLGVGDTIQLFDGQGRVATGCIVEAARGCVAVRVDGDPCVAQRPKPALTLFTAIPRAARQPFLFEKSTELGVATIVPTLFKHSTVRPEAKSAHKWRRAVVEAGKQCGELWLPHVAEPVELKDTLANRTEQVLMIGSPDYGQPLLVTLRQTSKLLDAAVWIGPEGGMTDEEEEALEGIGAKRIRLGVNVLRVETAAIAAAAAFALWREAMSGWRDDDL